MSKYSTLNTAHTQGGGFILGGKTLSTEERQFCWQLIYRRCENCERRLTTLNDFNEYLEIKQGKLDAEDRVSSLLLKIDELEKELKIALERSNK